jgi:nitrite reductase (NO-forming)
VTDVAPIQLAPRGTVRPRPIRRDADRRIALGSVVAAGVFVAAALLATLAGAPFWLPLHLVLAGAASTAIAGVLPFFATALAATPPADLRLRAAAIALVAAGAAGVASRALPAPAPIVTLGGVAFLGGLGLVLLITGSAIRAGLGARRPVVAAAYVAGLADVLAGAAISTLFVAGQPDVQAAWATLRPTHAWLNLLGFVGLIVTGTLLHLLPTVAGARIVDRRSGRIAVAGLVAGPPLVAAGLALAPRPAGDALARLGAVATLTAAPGIAAEAVAVARSRGRWTTDAAWHRIGSGSLVAAVGWFAVGLVLAAGRVLVEGASPTAWSTPLVAAPLAVGWVLQALVGSWSHLIPAIGPGGPLRHARRRAILGRWAAARLVAHNVGVGLLLGAWAFGIDAALLPGAGLVAGALAADLALVAAALRPERTAELRPGP